MKVITDKEVGELWNKLKGIESSEIIQLIRKLIEERVMGRYDSKFPREIGLQRALNDFGIDPVTYDKSTHN